MKEKNYLIAISGLVLILCMAGILGMCSAANREKESLQALVGKIYHNNPKAAADVLETALSVESSEQKEMAEAGRTAAYELGYTTRVYDFYFRQTGGNRSLLVWEIFTCCMGILIIAVLCGTYNRLMKKINRFRERIHHCMKHGEEWEVSTSSGKEWASLEHEIKDMIENSRKQDRYIDRRTKQMEMFIENLAHQIKTPLAGMLLNLELLEDRWRKGRDGTDLIQDSIQAGEKIKTYVMRLLDLARMEAGKICFQQESVELTELFEKIQKEFGEEYVLIQWLTEAEIENGKKEESESAGTFVIKGDGDWLYEAVFNLVENSIKYGETKEPVKIKVTESGKEIKVSIYDQGKGIAKEEIPYVFDRYYVGDSSEKFATGIGLNLAWYVIRGHHGDIHVESQPGKGTSMAFRLPKFGLKEKVITG